jgi:hypothetical protein
MKTLPETSTTATSGRPALFGQNTEAMLKEFSSDPYPSKERITELAKLFKKSKRQVKTWFSNER